jgi:hypothetical protein
VIELGLFCALLQVDNCEYGSWADLIASQRAMSTAIQATGRPMIIQIGAGDHMPLLNNPNASLSDSYARTFDDEAWVWCARPRQSFLSLSLSPTPRQISGAVSFSFLRKV